ncbi:MAG TPA: addiction module protein [Thermoanaerobaculia bacterium]|nr:addiction module protein [Thermoanaerobaculia bacterium]
MARTLEDLEAAALELPEEGRARLARVLLLSLGDTKDNETDQAWIEEAERRYQEIRRGEVEAQDSDEVFREARARLR